MFFLQFHTGITIVKNNNFEVHMHFNCGGGIYFDVLGCKKYGKNNFNFVFTQNGDSFSIGYWFKDGIKEVEELLWYFPLKNLKKIHSKVFSENLRSYAKKVFLDF